MTRFAETKSIYRATLGLLFLLLATPSHAEWATVLRVVDGDTIVVRLESGQKEKVRYLGIDTPETAHPRKPVEPGGPEASAANKALVDGKRVWLSRGPRNRDKYRRLLRRVSLEDGRDVIEHLKGMGHAKRRSQ